ncbi:MAG: FAD-dependent oxidoreductase [Deltaproteobacteria bacterium]|nr:FAD-dependent oxidoreductase [Deltaproteobacteria bacterium]
MILVIGGGITGLAAARTLSAAGEDFLVLEREDAPGGWCRSIPSGRYMFDRSGHFLHSADPRMRQWILDLPGVSWETVARDARVFLRGRITPYPFQANLHGHALDFIRRCLADFVTERIREALSGPVKPRHFEEWLLRRFGRAMCRAFFFPYNRKMWSVSLRGMGFGWTSWSVPVPEVADLLAGARGEIRTGMGYNPSFLYPRSGGIGALVSALASGVRVRVRAGTRISRVDLKKKIAWTADGEAFPFDAAISTIPLPQMAHCCENLPSGVRAAASALRWNKVLCINLGIRNPAATHGHWVYVPERTYPFFRVGFLSNVSPAAAPKGCAAVFVEKSFPSGARLNVGTEIRQATQGLRRMGILRPGRKPEVMEPVLLDPAYVVFDPTRDAAVGQVREYLRAKGVFTAGRYGAWDYNGMEASMSDGIRAAHDAINDIRGTSA